ncbi:hypothetical protein [Zavarzinia sp. CC-PAN008]|uniref:hypothetical protein n=1 Tax=Zavarzinia sp. CC-PAN008 TaxID=3243332 RepID=UPI003F747630
MVGAALLRRFRHPGAQDATPGGIAGQPVDAGGPALGRQADRQQDAAVDDAGTQRGGIGVAAQNPAPTMAGAM